MSKRPQFPVREKQKERVLREAHNRKEKRDEATFAILKDEADKSDQDRTNEESHKHVERRIWLKQIAAARMQIKVAKRLNRVTCVAAVFALMGVVAVAWSIRDARLATIAANRAWVGIYRADHGELSATKPMDIQLTLVNTGREPALRGNWGLRIHAIKHIPEANRNFIIDSELSRNEACDGVRLFPYGEGASIWPTLFHTPDPGNANDPKLGPVEIPYVGDSSAQDDIDAALTRGKSLILDACFVYWSGGQRRQTFARFL